MKTKALLAAMLVIAAACGKDNKKDVNLDINGFDYMGTITVENDGESIESQNVTVSYNLDKDGKTATVVIYGAKFAEKMPMIDITIPGVKVSGSSVYTTSLTCTGVDPIALGEANHNYVVTDFSGTASEDELNFTASFGKYPTTYTGTRKE